MADQSDVETSLVSLVSVALYPNGVGASSIPGVDCRIYRGWPQSTSLDNDLRAGVVNVTVFGGRGPGRLTTRYSDCWTSTSVVSSLSAQVVDTSVTFVGLAAPGQVAGIRAYGKSYVYRVQATDDAAAVAANLAVLVGTDRIAQLSDATVNIPGAIDLLARVVADAPSTRQVRRQSQTFRVTCWCPTAAARDRSAAAIDQSFAAISFIDLPDGSQGRLTYSGTSEFDQSRDALLYRRDLLYTVEYPTMISALQPAMLFGNLELNATTFIA